MVDAVVSGPELPVLDVADQVLREERVASPETIRDVHPSAETLLLGAGEALHRAPDYGAVDVEPDHQIRGEASGEAREVVPAMRADEVRRSEEHTSELQSLTNLVCRLLLEKKKPGI